MAETSEYERRCRAIRLSKKGMAFGAICARVGRSRFWLAKWLRRFQEQGWAGVREQSRAPRRIWRRTPARVVALVLRIRGGGAESEAAPTVLAAPHLRARRSPRWALVPPR